jgi:hypothetical protein
MRRGRVASESTLSRHRSSIAPTTFGTRFRGAERLGYRFAKRSTFHRETIERSSIQRATDRRKHPSGRFSHGRFFAVV